MLSSSDSQQLLIDFFKTGVRLEFNKNDYIIGPGESPRGVIFIESGMVKSYDITKYHEENLLIIRKAGEIIGLTWAITGEPKEVINTALTATTVWLVPRPKFNEFLRSHPDATLPVLDTITRMYKIHSDRIMTLAYRTVRERLASFLLSMADRFGKETSEGVALNAPLKQQDIASSISATRETTSRTLKSFENSGLIRLDQSVIALTDIDALRNIVSR